MLLVLKEGFCKIHGFSYLNKCRLNKHSKEDKAGAELCQAQHQLWKMLLEELDLDEKKYFSQVDYHFIRFELYCSWINQN